MTRLKTWSGSAWVDTRIWSGGSWLQWAPPVYDQAVHSVDFSGGYDGWACSTVEEPMISGWHSNGHIWVEGSGGLYGSGAGMSISPARTLFFAEGTVMRGRASVWVQRITAELPTELTITARCSFGITVAGTYSSYETVINIPREGWGWGEITTPDYTVPANNGNPVAVTFSDFRVGYDEPWQLSTPTPRCRVWCDWYRMLNVSNGVLYGSNGSGQDVVKVWDGSAWK